MVNFSVITLYELEFVLRIALAFIYGGLIGFERERVDRPAGLRTHILVALGSAQFTILSFYAFPGSDPARIAAAIVAGIGFIGAGTILQSKDKVTGITTAASLWITASIGMALGIGYYLVATLVVILTYITLKLKWLERRHN
jgi:putative Mg2+ transporter-C (MgtC) family protein